MPLFRLVPPRRGILLALFVGAAEIVGLAGRWTQWLGVWTATHTYLDVALVIALPAATGAAAWIGTMNKRSGLDSMARLASRAEWRIHTRELVETGAWLAAGFLVVAAVVLLATAQSASYGGVRLVQLLFDVVMLLTAAGIGLAAGRWMPWLLAAPLAAVTTYALLGVLVVSAEAAANAITPLDERSMTFYSVPVWVGLTQSAMWGLITLAIIASRSGNTRQAVAATWLAGVVAAPLLYVGPGDRQPDAQASSMECGPDRDGTVVCMPAAKAYLEPEVSEVLVPARARLLGLVDDRVSFLDDEARGTSAAAANSFEKIAKDQLSAGYGVAVLSDIFDLSAYSQIDRESFLAAFAVTSIPPNRAISGRRTDATPSDVVRRWFMEGLGVPIDGSAGPGAPVLNGAPFSFEDAMDELDWLRALTPSEREQWFQRHKRDILRGRLLWSDFQ